MTFTGRSAERDQHAERLRRSPPEPDRPDPKWCSADRAALQTPMAKSADDGRDLDYRRTGGPNRCKHGQAGGGAERARRYRRIADVTAGGEEDTNAIDERVAARFRPVR